MKKFPIKSAILGCITMSYSLNGMEKNANQPASTEEALITTVKSLKETVSLIDRYEWAEKIVAYDKSLFRTGEPRKYFKNVETNVSTISTKLALASRPFISTELNEHTNITPFIVGGIGLLCGVVQWYNKSRLDYWGISGLAFLSGAFSAVSAAALYGRYQIVRKLRTSKEILDTLQRNVDAWLTQEIKLQDDGSPSEGEENNT